MSMRIYLCVLLLFVSPITVSGSPIYKWVDEHGVTHYSEKQNAEEISKKIDVKPIAPSAGTGDGNASADRWKEQAEELRQGRLKREEEAIEKKEAKVRNSESKMFAEIVLQFGGAWVMGEDMEPQCREKYSMSCDELLNWKTAAYAKCKEEKGSDQDCGDDFYLAREYKPLTIEEQRRIGALSRSGQRRK